MYEGWFHGFMVWGAWVDKLHARRDSNQTLVYSVVSPELATSGALPIMLLTYANFNPLEFNLRNEKLHYTKGRKI